MSNELNLPSRIYVRIRDLNGFQVKDAGSFMLYWMHHAVHVHETPALNAAIASGDALGVRVLACQGLGCA